MIKRTDEICNVTAVYVLYILKLLPRKYKRVILSDINEMHMKIEIKYDCRDIDWVRVSEILRSVGMSSHPPEKLKKAFEASYCTVFMYDKDKLVGFGRAISDGSHQAAIYECAVVEEYQGHGLGKTIIHEILSRLPECNIILYAFPGKEGFYEKQGFRRMKTGMARFISQDQMTQKGFTE